MKTCYLIRHAKSSWDNPLLRDFDRPLNKRGFRDADFMPSLLKGRGVSPDQIVSSPANRAYTTATYFAKALGIPEEDIVKNKAIYEAYSEEILDVILQLDDSLDIVLLFGHNPGLTSLANKFATEYIPNVPTCGIVCLQSTADSWQSITPDNTKVASFQFPKQYFT